LKEPSFLEGTFRHKTVQVQRNMVNTELQMMFIEPLPLGGFIHPWTLLFARKAPGAREI